MGNIKLYHGGKRTKVENVLAWGLSPKQEFYCTRSRGLARAAQHSHGIESGFLEISVPEDVFAKCLEEGYLVERPYVGSIPIDHATEVVVGTEIGIAVINELLQEQPGSHLRKEKVIGRLFK